MEKKRTIKDWIIATRPWSLPASVTPIVVITAYLFWQSQINNFEINWINAVLSLLLMVFMHCGGNLISDYHDYTKGVDPIDCPNGVTWIRSGLFSPKEILHYGYILVCIASITGLAILLNSSLDVIWIGAACLILTIFYFWFKSHILGEIDILLCFALLPAIGLSLVSTGEWHLETMLISLTFGLMTVAILFINNTRDIKSDYQAGLRTLSYTIGLRASKVLYAALIIVPYILIAIYYIIGLVPVWSFLTYLTIPISIKMLKPLTIPGLDQKTAMLQMLFGITLTLSFILAAFI